MRIHAEQRTADAERYEANERRHLGEVEHARRETANVRKQLQETQHAQRELAEKLEAQREAAMKLTKRNADDLTARDQVIADLRRQLSESHAAEEKARQGAEDARRLAESNDARVQDLSEALAAARRTEEDLRSRLAALPSPSASKRTGTRGQASS